VAEACTRTIQGLVDGSIDLDNTDAVSDLFLDGSALDRAVARAVELLDDASGPEDPEAAAKILEDALAPIDNMGAYLDDETNAYRYFGSVAERVHHNTAVNEGGKQIRLVPDAYFNAHSNASIALGMLGENERALAHADVCLRLAPTSTYATMRNVRILEAESRIYEAADLIVEALCHAVTPRDAAICHYRLAYMQWKLGREDLAAACYQRSLNWDTEMSAQAREELDDLLNATEGLERPTDEQADALLAREGIPLGCLKSDYDHTLATAVACIDDGAFFSAGSLMAVLFATSNDDVVMGVYRSLKVPE
jgi:tetratricopeptide (TPR) repeat protein